MPREKSERRTRPLGEKKEKIMSRFTASPTVLLATSLMPVWRCLRARSSIMILCTDAAVCTAADCTGALGKSLRCRGNLRSTTGLGDPRCGGGVARCLAFVQGTLHGVRSIAFVRLKCSPHHGTKGHIRNGRKCFRTRDRACEISRALTRIAFFRVQGRRASCKCDACWDMHSNGHFVVWSVRLSSGWLEGPPWGNAGECEIRD